MPAIGTETMQLESWYRPSHVSSVLSVGHQTPEKMVANHPK